MTGSELTPEAFAALVADLRAELAAAPRPLDRDALLSGAARPQAFAAGRGPRPPCS